MKSASNKVVGIALSVLVSVCVAGVSFGEDGAGASPNTTSSSTPAGQTTSDQAALELGRSEVLPVSTYPFGWKGYGPSTEIKGLSFFAGFPKNDAVLLARCLKIPSSNIQTDPIEIAGQRFNGQTSNLAISENIEVFRSAKAAAVDAQAASNPRAPTCNGHLPGSQTGSELVNGVTLHVNKTKIADRVIGRYGDHDADEEVVNHDTIPKYHLKIAEYSDLVYIQKGRSEAVLFFSNQNAPVPEDFIAGLARAASSKLAPS